MSHDTRPRGADGAHTRDSTPGIDRMELHYRQQLSALVDGALAPDEARFLLRRLEHDQELTGGYERWQLYGQAMRGELGRMAAPDFAGRVAAALREEPLQATGHAGASRVGRLRWGGGAAALAASVAVVALFMGQTSSPDMTPGQPVPTVAASQAPAPEPVAPAAGLPAAVAAPATAVASATSVAAAEPAAAAVAPPPRRSARPQPVVRETLRAVASVRPAVAPPLQAPGNTQVAPAAIAAAPGMGPAVSADPFASVAPLNARPWPRAALPQPSAGAFNASFGESQARSNRPFYPFEPALPPVEGADAQTEAGQTPPPAGGHPPR